MPKWIRVRDTQTGHTFDLDARVLKHRRGVEPVNDPERWPDLEGPRAVPRPAKPYVGKDGKPRHMFVNPGEGGEAFIPRSGGQEGDASDPNQQTPDAPSDGGVSDTPTEGADRNPTRRARRTTDTAPADVPADTSKEQQR